MPTERKQRLPIDRSTQSHAENTAAPLPANRHLFTFKPGTLSYIPVMKPIQMTNSAT
jgi:hypothetical protein